MGANVAYDMSSIQRGKSFKPPRLVVYGAHGIGKSTFGADAPSPIFLPTEDGLGTIDTASFPLITSSKELYSALDVLMNEEHDFQTAVLDSADWLEDIFKREIKAENDPKDLAYGKDTVLLTERWKDFLEALTVLRNTRHMSVILLAHEVLRRYDSPETEPYDRLGPALEKKSAAKVMEWADAVLHAGYKTVIKKDDLGNNKAHNRGVIIGERTAQTTETPAVMAKNRYGMKHVIEFKWLSFQDAVAASAT